MVITHKWKPLLYTRKAEWRLPLSLSLSFPQTESESVSRSVVSDSLLSQGLQPSRFLCPWNSPGRNTGVGCITLSRGSFSPRDRTQVSCIALQANSFPSEPPGKPSDYPSLILFSLCWCSSHHSCSLYSDFPWT